MSGIRSLSRRPHITEYYATAASAPIYVNDGDSSVRVNPAGTGTTESVLLLGAAGVTGNFRVAAGNAAFVSGAATVNTGLSTVLSFQLNLLSTGFATGATEVSDAVVSSITTGSVSVQGYRLQTTTASQSGTGTFYWIAIGS